MIPDSMASTRSINEVVWSTSNAAEGAGGGEGGEGGRLGQGHPVIEELAVSFYLGSVQLDVTNLRILN